ncbi:hypothetical protein K8I28_07250 [bacterium]|nr:hypothetical protein [bacterium]
MKIRTYIQLLLFLLSLLFIGCINHIFVIDLSGTSTAQYFIQGDSLDMYDGRVSLADTTFWTFVGKEREDTDDETIHTLKYSASLEDTLPHPIAASASNGFFYVNSDNFLLVKRQHFTAVFPSWRVTERYGNLREFVPEEAEILQEEGYDTLLSRETQNRLRRQEAIGLQKGTSRRYMMQVREMVRIFYERNQETLEEKASNLGAAQVAESNFSSILNAYEMSFKYDDPLEVPLDWYHELKDGMVMAAANATGGRASLFAHIADSLNHRWHTWEDIQDDDLSLSLIIPAYFLDAQPDSTAGDTLFYNISGASLADSTYVIEAIAYNPVWVVDIAIFAILLVFPLTIIVKRMRSKSS